VTWPEINTGGGYGAGVNAERSSPLLGSLQHGRQLTHPDPAENEFGSFYICQKADGSNDFADFQLKFYS